MVLQQICIGQYIYNKKSLQIFFFLKMYRNWFWYKNELKTIFFKNLDWFYYKKALEMILL